jgi:hypothetical protein
MDAAGKKMHKNGVNVKNCKHNGSETTLNNRTLIFGIAFEHYQHDSKQRIHAPLY